MRTVPGSAGYPLAEAIALNRRLKLPHAHAAREAARAELAGITEPTAPQEAEIYAMIDSLGDVGAKLNGDKPTSLARLYEDLGLQLGMNPWSKRPTPRYPRVWLVRVSEDDLSHYSPVACSTDEYKRMNLRTRGRRTGRP